MRISAIIPALLLATAALTPAAAVARSAMVGPFAYQVAPGDTLMTIANAYLSNPNDYRTLQTVNRVRDPRRIPVGSTLTIPRSLLKTTIISARITAFRGNVTVGAEAARRGMVVSEGGRIQTGPNSSVSLAVEDGSTIALPSNSRIRIERLRSVLISGEVERVFRLEAGKSQYDVPHSESPGNRFDVVTPVAVAAVRGTAFRVSYDDAVKSSATETLRGEVGLEAGPTNVSVPGGFGVIAREAGAGDVVKLLEAPVISNQVERAGSDGVRVTIKPVEGAVKYHLQFALDTRFGNITNDLYTTDPVFTIAGLSENDYFISISAVDGNGLEGMTNVYPFPYHPTAAATQTSAPPAS
ncbi:FecR domain-containing protein [Sphingomonas sp. ID0503]|uniref:FecR domain-containing protein n=1 Tax=Sphingomonas sp. ID0503 TaxID=3399691 RepID=UPI003AFB08F6